MHKLIRNNYENQFNVVMYFAVLKYGEPGSAIVFPWVQKIAGSPWATFSQSKTASDSTTSWSKNTWWCIDSFIVRTPKHSAERQCLHQVGQTNKAFIKNNEIYMSNYKFEFFVLCKQNNVIFKVESEKQKCPLDYVSLLQLCPVTTDFDHSHWANISSFPFTVSYCMPVLGS